MDNIRKKYPGPKYLSIVFRYFSPFSHILNPRLGDEQCFLRIFIQDFRISDFYYCLVLFQEFKWIINIQIMELLGKFEGFD